MAYGPEPPELYVQFLVGGFSLTIYTLVYLAIFGLDEVKWMFINAGIGILGIYSQIGWLLSLFGRDIEDYPYPVHVIPFLYFVLYTFLVGQPVVDMARSRDNPARRKIVEHGYVVVSVGIYVISYFLRTRP